MYASRSELAAFDHLSDAAKCRIILELVRVYTLIDRLIIRELGIPPLYECGVAYEFQPASGDAWKDIIGCLVSGRGSCNSLAAWRCAELQEDGEDARPYIQTQTLVRPDGSTMDVFHVLVHRPPGAPVEWEDPSRTLGMPPAMPNSSPTTTSGVTGYDPLSGRWYM